MKEFTLLPDMRYYLEEHWLIHIIEGRSPKVVLNTSDADFWNTIPLPDKFHTPELVLALKVS